MARIPASPTYSPFSPREDTNPRNIEELELSYTASRSVTEVTLDNHLVVPTKLNIYVGSYEIYV